MALAEARIGSAKGKTNVVGITLGTGVGGGIIVQENYTAAQALPRVKSGTSRLTNPGLNVPAEEPPAWNVMWEIGGYWIRPKILWGNNLFRRIKPLG